MFKKIFVLFIICCCLFSTTSIYAEEKTLTGDTVIEHVVSENKRYLKGIYDSLIKLQNPSEEKKQELYSEVNSIDLNKYFANGDYVYYKIEKISDDLLIKLEKISQKDKITFDELDFNVEADVDDAVVNGEVVSDKWKRISTSKIELKDLEVNKGYAVSVMIVFKEAGEENDVKRYDLHYKANSASTLKYIDTFSNFDYDSFVNSFYSNDDTSDSDVVSDLDNSDIPDGVKDSASSQNGGISNNYSSTKSDENPNTGIEDNVIYFVIPAIVIGSALVLKRKFA